MRRVVITGMGGVTSLGNDWETVRSNFEAGKTGIRRMAEWDRYSDMNTRLGISRLPILYGLNRCLKLLILHSLGRWPQALKVMLNTVSAAAWRSGITS